MKEKQVVLIIGMLIIGLVFGYLIGSGTSSNSQNLDFDKNFMVNLANQSIFASDWCLSLGGYWYGEPQFAEIPIDSSIRENYENLGFNVLEKDGQIYIQAITVNRYCITPSQ